MDQPEVSSEQQNMQARAAAIAAIESLQVNPAGTVQYQSRGRVAIIGGEDAQWFASRIQAPLQAQIILTEGAEEPGAPTVPVGNRSYRLDGYLGDFRLELGTPGKANHEIIQVDMVVDLGEKALIDRELPPPGYWHSSTEPQALDALLINLGDMVGTFEKPRFFQYDASICAHARAGQVGCERCIQACPAEAIIAIGEQVEVNPKLCQGGGICASVCPTGAMRYAYPSPADTLERLRLLLKHYQQAGGVEPIVLFVAEEDASGLQLASSNVLLLVVEELASVGLEVWLSALAWGAKRVILFDAGSVLPGVHTALSQQLDICAALLGGLAYPNNAVGLVAAANLEPECCSVMLTIPVAGFAALHDKRQQARFALDHLTAHANIDKPVIGLPAKAPFGQILVDTERCTLCMSCTSVCPAKALNGGEDTPQLIFHENNCVQCGICAQACPEQAITLQARFLGDQKQRAKPKVLHEEPPFCCISCGKPFATHKVIGTILEKLANHAMFQSERAKARLQMCEDCRVVDAVQDPEAMQASVGVAPQAGKGKLQ